jgi:hypothetical protein
MRTSVVQDRLGVPGRYGVWFHILLELLHDKARCVLGILKAADVEETLDGFSNSATGRLGAGHGSVTIFPVICRYQKYDRSARMPIAGIFCGLGQARVSARASWILKQMWTSRHMLLANTRNEVH